MQNTAAERLAALRLRLEKARKENLNAVEQESRIAVPDRAAPHNSDDAGNTREKMSSKRKRKRSSGRDGIDDDEDEEDPVLKSINARAAQIVPTNGSSMALQPKSVPAVYGGNSGTVSVEHSERLVDELKATEARRKRFRRRRAFIEETADISFINEGNKNFNRILDKHYDGFESVKKIKDSLERGTALP